MFYTKKWGTLSCREELKMLSRAEEMRTLLIYTAEAEDGKRIYWRGRKGDMWSDHDWKDSQGHVVDRNTRVVNLHRV